MDIAYHSMIYGCKDSDVYITNPSRTLNEKTLQKFVCTNFFTIPAKEILQRIQEDLNESKMDKAEYLKQFSSLSFLPKKSEKQIEMILNIPVSDLENKFVNIPWNGFSGVTIFAKEGTKAFEKLKQIEQDKDLVSKLTDFSSIFEFFTETIMKQFHEKLSEEERPSSEDIKGIYMNLFTHG